MMARFSFQRFFAVFHARNLEFLRDRAAIAWNFIFPIILVLGLAYAFSGPPRPMLKVGLLHSEILQGNPVVDLQNFLAMHAIEFINYSHEEPAIDKVRHHQLDLLIDLQAPVRYWINESSTKGHIAERLLNAETSHKFQKATVQGLPIRYVDWLLPGILAMNMMFSCLFGVGYVIVRYRKNGVLKRLKVTPLTAFEFLLAQVCSRLIIIMITTPAIFFGSHYFLHFHNFGSLWNLLLIAFLGATCLISLGLLVAARANSEEFASGLLNLLCWPMMFLSGVWFSLEGAPSSLTYIANIFPLTHIIEAARAVMIDGATILDIWMHCVVLSAMTLFFLTVAAIRFRWDS